MTHNFSSPRFLIAPVTLVLLLAAAACGGGGSGSSTPAPTTPTAPTTQNRAPSISSVTVAPSFGVSQVTQFLMTASATDPDGDAVTYTWDFGDGRTAQGPAYTKIYDGSGIATVKLSISDGKGGTASDTRQITVGSAAGKWDGSIPGYTAFVFDLQQSGPVVSGTFIEAYFGTGQIDTAQPGRIDSEGNVEMRFKLSRFSDFTFRGKMDSTGRRITGGVFGSGFNGQAFTMTKR